MRRAQPVGVVALRQIDVNRGAGRLIGRMGLGLTDSEGANGTAAQLFTTNGVPSGSLLKLAVLKTSGCCQELATTLVTSACPEHAVGLVMNARRGWPTRRRHGRRRATDQPGRPTRQADANSAKPCDE